MKDVAGIQMRLRERTTLSTLQRIVPGDYRTLAEIEHPTLLDAGFEFGQARIYDKPLKKSVPALFLGDSLAERQDPVAGIIRGKGDWTFVTDPQCGGGAGLWLLTVVDFPDRFLKPLIPVSEGAGAILMRPLKQGWLVAVQSTLLKTIIKNGRRGNPEF